MVSAPTGVPAWADVLMKSGDTSMSRGRATCAVKRPSLNVFPMMVLLAHVGPYDSEFEQNRSFRPSPKRFESGVRGQPPGT